MMPGILINETTNRGLSVPLIGYCLRCAGEPPGIEDSPFFFTADILFSSMPVLQFFLKVFLFNFYIYFLFILEDSKFRSNRVTAERDLVR